MFDPWFSFVLQLFFMKDFKQIQENETCTMKWGMGDIDGPGYAAKTPKSTTCKWADGKKCRNSIHIGSFYHWRHGMLY